MLQEEGYYLNTETDEIVNVMQKVAEYKYSIQKIEKWVREKATATSEPVSLFVFADFFYPDDKTQANSLNIAGGDKFDLISRYARMLVGLVESSRQTDTQK